MSAHSSNELFATSGPEIDFAEFYRARLTRVVGHRIAAVAVMEAYCDWLSSRGHGLSVSYRLLKRLMRERGHGHFYSNGARYRDVAFSEAGSPAMERIEAADLSRTLDLIARLDVISAELAQLRAHVAAALP